MADTKMEAFICDAVRTPIGRLGGVLSNVRPDDLAAIPITALMERNQRADWDALDDVILGCANQSGEDNRNVARMAVLLSGISLNVPGATVNRLCGSGMDAVIQAARAIQVGAGEFYIAGGVESMSRAPFVLSKGEASFDRDIKFYDTTLGWRFINPTIETRFGVDPLGITAENVAEKYEVSRADQDAMALRSQQRAAKAQASGRFSKEIISVGTINRKDKTQTTVTSDEHPRSTTAEKLAGLQPAFRKNGTVTAGNSSGLNDGAAAIIIASRQAVLRHNLVPRARILGAAVAGVAPAMMGIGPVPAISKLLAKLQLSIGQFDCIEINEAFAAQTIAVLREVGVREDAEYVNPNGGAIALGHPLGMSGTRLIQTAVEELASSGLTRALCTMCIGVGQGIACAIEKV